MKSIQKILIATAMLLSFTASNAQIKNAKTETLKVYGNCGMCKSNIEKAGTVKKLSKTTWDASSKMATISYDASKTNIDEILKQIALVGYDSDKFLAPDATYEALHSCCQYDREAKNASTVNKDHSIHNEETKVNIEQTTNPLDIVFSNYFLVKDALTKTDVTSVAANSKVLFDAINTVDMNKLSPSTHTVWMNVYKDLSADAKIISDAKDINKQREAFKSLSKNTYDLIKTSKSNQPVYYQYCPMVDANWLSKENTIKNPYYGSQMLNCGKVVETIQ